MEAPDAARWGGNDECSSLSEKVCIHTMNDEIRYRCAAAAMEGRSTRGEAGSIEGPVTLQQQ